MIGTISNLPTETSTLLIEKESSETTALATIRMIVANEGSKLFCRYYKKNMHIIDVCWKLHRKLEEGRPLRPNNSWRSSSRQPFKGSNNAHTVQRTVQGTVLQKNDSSLPTRNQIKTLLLLNNQHIVSNPTPIQATMASTQQITKVIGQQLDNKSFRMLTLELHTT